MSKVDEALKGTVYEGGEYMHWGFERDKALTQHDTKFGNYNHAGCLLLVDAARNAAKSQHAERLAEALEGVMKDYKEQCEEDGGFRLVFDELPEIIVVRDTLTAYRALVAEIGEK